MSRISFALPEGGSLALLGRNGTGKTTLINTIIGVTRRSGGTIRSPGATSRGLTPHQRAQAGIGWVPQERNIFRSLTVEENLTAIARQGRGRWSAICGMFPRLGERRRNLGNQLSGGEQQMLAVAARSCSTRGFCCWTSRSKGLRQSSSRSCSASSSAHPRRGCRRHPCRAERTKILPLTQRALVLERGMIAYEGESRELLADPEMMASLLGVAERKPTRH